MTKERPDYRINGKPIEQRCATVTMPVEMLRAIHQMQMLRNDGRAEVLVRLSDWRVVEHPPLTIDLTGEDRAND